MNEVTEPSVPQLSHWNVEVINVSFLPWYIIRSSWKIVSHVWENFSLKAVLKFKSDSHDSQNIGVLHNDSL